MIPIYDAHNHLQDERIAHAREELPKIGLRKCVVNGTCEKDWPQVAALAQRFDWIIPAFGLHPWFTKDRSTGWFDTLQRFLDAHPGACIGEIGLDRWMRDPDIQDQENIFTQQLELAISRNLAVSIHCLKAWGRLNDLLAAHRARFLIHSYGGAAELIPVFEKLGGYFSISGYFAHERKSAQREAFKLVPIERLLVETDAPDMLGPAELIRNEAGEKVNDPRNIERVYQFGAALRGMPIEQFAAQIEKNFARLFGG